MTVIIRPSILLSLAILALAGCTSQQMTATAAAACKTQASANALEAVATVAGDDKAAVNAGAASAIAGTLCVW